MAPPPLPDHLFIADEPSPGKPPRRAGDRLRFGVVVYIDHYENDLLRKPALRHLVYDLYRISFSPVAKFKSHFSRNSYHYLVDLGNGIQALHINHLNRLNDYLRPGEFYTGYGRLAVAGEWHTTSPGVPPPAIQGIFLSGRIEKIVVNRLYQDTLTKYYGDPVSATEAFDYSTWLRSMGVFTNPAKLQATVEAYRDNSQEIPKTSAVRIRTPLVYQLGEISREADESLEKPKVSGRLKGWVKEGEILKLGNVSSIYDF